jgi:hypothetical protein
MIRFLPLASFMNCAALGWLVVWRGTHNFLLLRRVNINVNS